MRQPAPQHDGRECSCGARDQLSGASAWRVAAAIAVAVALEVADPPVLAFAIGAPILARLAPGRVPSPLRIALETAAKASPLQRPILALLDF